MKGDGPQQRTKTLLVNRQLGSSPIYNEFCILAKLEGDTCLGDFLLSTQDIQNVKSFHDVLKEKIN